MPIHTYNDTSAHGSTHFTTADGFRARLPDGCYAIAGTIVSVAAGSVPTSLVHPAYEGIKKQISDAFKSMGSITLPMTTIHVTASGNATLVQEMIVDGVDFNKDHGEGITPLHIAAYMGVFGCLELLVEDNPGVDVNRTDGFGMTPTHIVAAAPDGDSVGVECLKELIVCGNADINRKDGVSGATPAHLAAKAGNTKCLELLISKGADMTLEDNDGFTPAHYNAAGESTA